MVRFYSGVVAQEGVSRAIRMLGSPGTLHRYEVVSRDPDTGAERKQLMPIAQVIAVVQPASVYAQIQPGNMDLRQDLAYNYPWKAYLLSDALVRVNDILELNGQRYVVRLVQRYDTHYELYMDYAQHAL